MWETRAVSASSKRLCEGWETASLFSILCMRKAWGVPKTILRIIERAGGWNPGLFLKIENAPYMALVHEAIEAAPSGLPTISVTYFGEQNGDLMRDRGECVSSFGMGS